MITIPLPPPANMPAAIVPQRITEQDLVHAVKHHCEDKFTLLYQMYAPALMGIISRIVKQEEIAEDVLQDTFVKIWNSFDSYDASRGRLFTWMAATARHTAIDQLRSKAQINSNKNSNIEDHSKELENSNRTSYDTDAIGVRQLTCNLPVAEKEILDLVYFKGYTHSEAAEILNIPIGTIKTRIRRAIILLRLYF